MDTAIAVIDLGFGDAGKGTTVDWLARTTPDPLVVRFNGGPQAAHNVVTPEGRHHTFASFGSGTFVPGCPTLLDKNVLVNPTALFAEEAHLRACGVNDALNRLYIHEECRMITTWHKALNRLRETARGSKAHGTCGHGVGETVHADIRFPELTLRYGHPSRAALIDMRDMLHDEAQQIDPHSPELRYFTSPTLFEDYWRAWKDLTLYATTVDSAWLSMQEHNIIFEGAQGVLLDQDHGFHPHTTWSNCTVDNVRSCLADAYLSSGDVYVMGVVRTYQTRHGAGPFPTENPEWLLANPELHNSDGTLQGAWRAGAPDLLLTRYAVDVLGGIDWLMVTHCDLELDMETLPVAVGYNNVPGEGSNSCFTRTGETVTRIKPGNRQHSPTSYVTDAIWNAKPVYRNIPTAQYPRWLARTLGCDLYGTSHGTTADHKTLVAKSTFDR